MTPIALALACLLAAGLLDLVFKIYALKPGSKGLMVAGVAGIWGILQTTLMVRNDLPFTPDQPTLFYGGLAALAVTMSNLALLECFARLPISVASTIYRLNTIPLVLMAVVFLGEQLDAIRASGVLVGLLTVALLHSRSGSANKIENQTVLWFGVIIFASCVRACYGILTKAGINAGADTDSMMLLAALGWLLGGLLYYFIVEAKKNISIGPVHLIVTAGVLVFSVVWLLTTALLHGDASVVVPITNMGFVAAFTFSVLWKLETFTLKKTAAIITAIASIVLLTFGHS